MSKDTKEVYLVFKPEDDNQIVWPCKIEVPLSGGGFQQQILKARFKVLPKARQEYFYPTQLGMLAALEKATADLANAVPQDGPVPTPARRGDEGLLDEALLGLVDVPGDHKLSETDLAAKMRQKPWIEAGLVTGYFEMTGQRLSKN
jgi:hypothetical protein